MTKVSTAVARAVSDFGAACAAKLQGPGDREAAIRSPLEALVQAIGKHVGVPAVLHDEVRDVVERREGGRTAVLVALRRILSRNHQRRYPEVVFTEQHTPEQVTTYEVAREILGRQFGRAWLLRTPALTLTSGSGSRTPPTTWSADARRCGSALKRPSGSFRRRRSLDWPLSTNGELGRARTQAHLARTDR